MSREPIRLLEIQYLVFSILLKILKKLYLAKNRTDYLKRVFNCSGALRWNNFPIEKRTKPFKSDSHTTIMKNS